MKKNKRNRITSRYWDDFLKWGDTERSLAESFIDIYLAGVNTEPTESNFWKWYMSARLKG